MNKETENLTEFNYFYIYPNFTFCYYNFSNVNITKSFKKNLIFNNFTLQIVGWGNTEKMIQSQILLETYLPIIDQITCRNMYTNGFQYFVTSDKFCAGSQLGNEKKIIIPHKIIIE